VKGGILLSQAERKSNVKKQQARGAFKKFPCASQRGPCRSLFPGRRLVGVYRLRQAAIALQVLRHNLEASYKFLVYAEWMVT
jgi:hypothetical protein